MTRLIRISTLVSIAVLMFMGTSVAQNNVAVDSTIRKGVLPNGLTYFIKHNAEPKERASFYIIQNVGAVLEEDNQNGLAHFLEHMAFNGTKHFPGKGILNTLQRHGVAFGRNINAYTSFDETVYNLSEVPTTHDGLIDTCLLVLYDWCDNLLLTEEEIDSERGVITEEWRTRRNSAARIRNQWFPVVFAGSPYAVRDVIGDTTVIRYHHPNTLRKFYHDWYRTDLQAIAIVGDINVDEVEAKVIDLFSAIAPIENPMPRTATKIPEHDDVRFVLATDNEATTSRIMVFSWYNNNDGECKTEADLREGIAQSLFNSMSAMRIQELLQKENPPFVNGSTSIGGFLRGYNVYNLNAVANTNQQALALRTIALENERIKRYGFLNSELERVKATYMTQLESRYKERNKISSDTYCRDIVQHYLTKSPLTSMEFDYAFASRVVPQITIDEIAAYTQKWMQFKNRSVVITGPSEGVNHITKEEALAILTEVEKLPIEPYAEETTATELVTVPLKGSPIKKSKQLEAFGGVEWTLKNGAKVVYRKADYEKDRVDLYAMSYGGMSLLNASNLPSAIVTTSLISSYGLGDVDAITLRKMLAGKSASVSPFLGELSEGFSGRSTPRDFETMLQLLYLMFEQPRFDETAHGAFLNRIRASMENSQKDPSKIMSDSLNRILTSYNPRQLNINTELLDNVSMQQIEEVYRNRFTDADDFIFFIVGNIDESEVKPLVEKYIGSIVKNKRKENWIDQKLTLAKGTVEKQIQIPFTTPKANVNVVFRNDLPHTIENTLAMQILKSVLDLRYTETIREEEGGTYGVRVSSSTSKIPVAEGLVRIMFDCDPAKADRLKSIAFAEIDKIIANGPTAVDFDKTVKNMLKNREQSLNYNSFWMGALQNYYSTGINIVGEENYEQILKKMTADDIKQFAAAFFANADKTDVVFVPVE